MGIFIIFLSDMYSVPTMCKFCGIVVKTIKNNTNIYSTTILWILSESGVAVLCYLLKIIIEVRDSFFMVMRQIRFHLSCVLVVWSLCVAFVVYTWNLCCPTLIPSSFSHFFFPTLKQEVKCIILQLLSTVKVWHMTQF